MKPEKIATFRRRMTLAALVIVIVAGIYFYFAYGSWKVLAGMETMIPEYPPGATCIIEKNPSRVQAKSVIILEVSGGAALLSRVDRVDGEKIYIKHDNRQSEFRHFEERAYTIADVRGLVLTVLIPEAPHGK
jgi:hypothetical protein